VDHVLSNEAPLSDREQAFRQLVSASHVPHEDTRRVLVLEAAKVLSVGEVYHATAVIALFNFYNKFVDLNGVAELSAEGYAASGVRLSTQGYGPPAGAGQQLKSANSQTARTP
jgi:hypothetical protein